MEKYFIAVLKTLLAFCVALSFTSITLSFTSWHPQIVFFSFYIVILFLIGIFFNPKRKQYAVTGNN